MELKDLQEICRRMEALLRRPVVVAGGAPRDLVLGKAVKDIDIFFPCTPEEDLKEGGFKTILQEYFKGYDLNFFKHPLEEDGREGPNEYGEYSSLLDRPWRVADLVRSPSPWQFMTLEGFSPDEWSSEGFLRHILSTFDMSICRIGVTKNEIYYSPEFLETQETKVVKVYQKYGTHFDRMVNKYPEFTFDESDVSTKEKTYKQLTLGTLSTEWIVYNLSSVTRTS